MEVIIIRKDDNTLIRTFGEVEQCVVQYNIFSGRKPSYKYKIKLDKPLSDVIDVGRTYPIELQQHKVIFMGYISSDRKTIIED